MDFEEYEENIESMEGICEDLKAFVGVLVAEEEDVPHLTDEDYKLIRNTKSDLLKAADLLDKLFFRLQEIRKN